MAIIIYSLGTIYYLCLLENKEGDFLLGRIQGKVYFLPETRCNGCLLEPVSGKAYMYKKTQRKN